MQRTPLYKQIAARKPKLLDELLKPERLRLIGNPEMIRALIRMDNSVQQILAKKKWYMFVQFWVSHKQTIGAY